jgi:hypothetical protein
MHCSLLTFLLLLLAIPAICFSWPTKVVYVTDGAPSQFCTKARKKKSDCMGLIARKGQSYGEQAKALTSALVAGKNVDAEQKDVSRREISTRISQDLNQNYLT